jgi:ATP/maltotriose-dependent transcriptional regulator MalT
MTMPRTPRPNPYVGPRSFAPGERLYGRGVETRKLANLLGTERVVLLHSPSGAGKTSLVALSIFVLQPLAARWLARVEADE